ncbi:Na+/H+ antiporter [Paenarthrobacter sp. PH39-S1]|uniref:Na+/H+ antiporter n=1 Tax=Paenarthrobacter sp. PH39-S1 TaxID=3046204 RepID=UPI0024BA8A67|nr:Na+/H+ antiporter [Paenarthrobacter sp. PH39-S1]MDJ0358020.1 Na+/H+ antiporter [Paenarthrobacter sp. PH39-S1]
MEILALVVGLMLATVLMVGLGDRIRLPYPVLMIILSAGAAFIPGFPRVHIDPELILPLFLPPLLFAAALKTSWSVFRIRWRSIVLLAVALVVVTTATVAGVAWLLIPGIGIPAAIALGAMVAPPDPVAVQSVAARVRMPRRLTSVLQSEGLFNDATAIVIFQAAVAAALEGEDVGAGIVGSFLLGAAGAALLGFAAGWITKKLTQFITNPVGHSAATLVVPFAVYIAADSVHASGVVAVVITALEIRRGSHPDAAEERVTVTAFWDVVELLVTGIAFGLVGLEVRQVVQGQAMNIMALLWPAVLICLLCFAVRAAWLAMMVLPRWRKNADPPPSKGKDVVALTWCGMRGLATLALALALPSSMPDGSPFPARSQIVLLAVAILLSTLVLPGLTLPWLMKYLGIEESPETEKQAEQELAARAQEAAMAAVESSDLLDGVDQKRIDWVKARLRQLHSELAGAPTDAMKEERSEFRGWAITVQSLALDAARQEMVTARGEAGADPMVTDRVLHRLDLRTMLVPD